MFFHQIARWLGSTQPEVPPRAPVEPIEPSRSDDTPISAACRSPSEGQPRGSLPAQTAASELQPARPTAASSPANLPAARSLADLLHLKDHQLSHTLDSIARIQEQTYLRIRQLQSDIQAVVSRHAQVRLLKRKTEQAALVRIYRGLKLQLFKAEQFHTELLNQQQLLENLNSIREFASMRQKLRQGVLANLNHEQLLELIDNCLASDAQERQQAIDLLHAFERYHDDLVWQARALDAEAEEELSAQSEAEFQMHLQHQEPASRQMNVPIVPRN